MLEKIIFFILSVIMGGTLFLLYAEVRASGLHDRRMKGFSALCLVVPFWILMSATVAITDGELFPVLYSIKALLVEIVPYMSIWFLLHYIESKLASSRIVRAYLIIMPLLSVISLATNPLHHLHYVTYSSPPVVGPFFIGHMIPSIAGLLVVYVLLFRYVLKNFRNQPLIILSGLGALLPIVLYIVYIFADAVQYDIASIGYFFTIIIFTYTSYRSRLHSSKPWLLGDTLAKIAISPEMSSTTTDDISYLVAKEACVVLGAYRASVWSLDEKTQILTNVACYCYACDDFCTQDDVDLRDFANYKRFLETERVVLISDVQNPQLFKDFTNNYAPEVCSHADAPR